jgi:GNAT superfamily N-acetyltransferase/ribosomal protein S18 acetylase RimI-like enzyme
MQIIPVQTKEDLKAFIELPYQLYKDDPVWVAPLRSEQAAQFVAAKNPMLDHCTYALFLAREGDRVVGRISVFLDHLALEHWKQPIGLFGSFESIQDEKVGLALLQTAVDWLKEKGMSSMRGPWSFASQEWGLVVEGYTPDPVIMGPYNPPYYNDFMQKFGMQKAKDLKVYIIDASTGYQLPDRILNLTEIIKRRYGVTVRPVDMKNVESDVVAITNMANESISDNWGFYPVTEGEARAMARDMKQILNPKGALIAEDANGKPIGFAISLPDINKLIKGLDGRLGIRGIWRMLTRLPKLHQYRMWALGVIPEYQSCAIDSLLYKATYDGLYTPDIRMEINYVLEDNDRMNNALYKLGVKDLRRYRVYEKAI